MDKQNVVVIHTMEYHLALKRKEFLDIRYKVGNLQDIMLSEISWSPNDKYCMNSLI